MGDRPYPGPQSNVTRDLNEMLATQQGSGGVLPEEMAQRFLSEIQRDIDTRIDWRIDQQVATRPQSTATTFNGQMLGMALGSLGVAIPLSAIAGAAAGFLGILVVWIGVVLINVAWTQRR